MYNTTSRISRLPPYVLVHMVRFYWRTDTKAKAKITAGQGQLGFLNSSSLNGKNFGRMLVCTALDVATACRTALDDYADEDDSGNVASTGLDFRGLND